MKLSEFKKIKDELVDGREVIVRYFTYHKKVYADIVGVINNIYGINKVYDGNIYSFTIELKYMNDTYNLFGNSSRDIKFFTFQDKIHCHLYSNRIISVKTGSIISFKLKKLKEKIIDD